MEKINLHRYYYKEYFNLGREQFDYIFNQSPKGDKSLVSRKNEKLTSDRFSELIPNTNPRRYKTIEIPNECDDNAHSFQLKITYPGLVTGVGTTHEAKIEGEFKLGVHFDYTYGMPVVYGSSVKGVLRAWFREFYNENIDVLDLEMEIFEGKKRNIEIEKSKYKENWKELCVCSDFSKLSSEDYKHLKERRVYEAYKSIYNRDIFFDAVLVKADKNGRILCSDSITPHGGEHHDNPLKNPTPITFLKIAPGCEMEFRFKLVDSVIDEQSFTAADKKKLFEEIIRTVGVGAKTNVGYGQFEYV